ncbi:hypothetical protein KC19_9G008900 [Ceratodon purpureus]|uniref:Armadillo-like helical domain-containing protein n=1 Tax=Ceratodon purpureus TaxID=3225 RepID=A0A8T0GQK5_CERPU|nr:hypothetical protein KC19_9G008900 [Ceratodon purpureus]KAG0560736.1 hypothetical protein KC19_9G008900 [Ceratodon purpureus]KAG0560737.1 hypothetical protein KC19_9G008900 [Ceratodon purpureus]KAG0560738.1 hypothetical protein KC19_9G008900 [Ceratodon purpureus]
MQNQGLPASRQIVVTPTKSDNYRPGFKEKFVSLYEDIFALRSPLQTAKDQGIQGRVTIGRFWDELLLLKVNEAFLSQCISKASEEQLQGNLRPVINDLFATCVRYFGDDNFIRVAHALETLTVLLREIFKKRFNEQGSTILTLVAGAVDNADSFFKRLITSIAALLTRDDVPVLVKSLGIKVYLTILTATTNVNTNTIASYLFVYNAFDGITAVFNVKLSTDRRKLELDASLVLILLLLWRESSNPYAERLVSPAAPILPLLNTVASLLSPPTDTPISDSDSLFNSNRSANDGGLLGYISSFFGLGSYIGDTSSDGVSGIVGSKTSDVWWCNTSAGLLLLYFLFYLNPVVKSAQVWPSSNLNSVQGPSGLAAPGQAAVLLWSEIMKSFLSISKEAVSQLATSGVSGVLRAKLCFTIFRCMAEDRVASDFLLRCDSQSYVASQVPTNGLIGIPYVIQFKSISSLMLELAANVLALKPEAASYLDADLFYRAAALVSIILNSLKTKGLQLSSTSLNWLAVWDGLLETCAWCGEEKDFQRPGVPELASLALGTVEMCLGSNPELWAGPDETERLHAVVMAHMSSLEQLGQTSAASPYGEAARAPLRGRIQLVNVLAVKYHYEVQIAGLGVRGQPTMEQALLGVRKKGTSNLKLKSTHAGPGHSYTEGTSDLRMLNNLARAVLFENRKQFTAGTPKQELEAM